MDVEIWADLVCPWCYIGKRRFEAALARFEGAGDVRVTWRSYQLDPSAPATSDQAIDEVLAAKYGMTPGEAAAANERVTALAAAEGLAFHLDRARPANTFDAHRLVQLAARHGLQDEAEERLFAAYFTEGAALADHDTLVILAEGIGLAPDEVRTMLASDALAAEVRADQQVAAELGVRGVPFFVIDRRLAVSGAQPADTFLEAFRS